MNYPKELLSGFYRTMQRIRLSEESLVEPILTGEVRCPVHLYSGEEAIATGVCAHLTKHDSVFGNHRSHGHYLAKGGDLKEMFSEIYGKENGCSRGRGGSMHLISPENGVMGIAPIVAGTISLALGSALASKIRGDKNVTVTFFGDGATGEGVLYESLNFAALKKLPIIFVCENNFYSTHLPIDEIRTNRNIFNIASPFGVPSVREDGNDVLKVFETAKKAVEDCRNGNGPWFIEFLTYRQRGHVGPDDNVQGSHTDIRPKSEVDEWFAKDPIKLFENYMMHDGIMSADELHKVKESVVAEVKEAKLFAVNSEKPKKEDLLKYVYK